MKRICFALASIAVLIGMAGCQQSRSASISVSLHNDSAQPVTAWLTKTGERSAEWLAPEDLALVPKPEMINGVVIPPGKTGEMGPVAGKFEPDSFAVLRVYVGQLDFDHLLATGPDSPLRFDVTLDNGMNRLQVKNSAKLEVIELGEH